MADNMNHQESSSFEKLCSVIQSTLQNVELLFDGIFTRSGSDGDINNFCDEFNRLSRYVKELIRKVIIHSERLMNRATASHGQEEYISRIISNERKLDIALHKLQVLEGRNTYLERLHTLSNWQKLYMQVTSHKHSYVGWRKILEDFSYRDKHNLNIKIMGENKISVTQRKNEDGLKVSNSISLRRTNFSSFLKTSEYFQPLMHDEFNGGENTFTGNNANDLRNNIQVADTGPFQSIDVQRTTVPNHKVEVKKLNIYTQTTIQEDRKVFLEKSTYTFEEQSLGNILNVRILTPVEEVGSGDKCLSVAVEKDLKTVQFLNSVYSNQPHVHFSFVLPNQLFNIDELKLRVGFRDTLKKPIFAFSSCELRELCIYNEVEVAQNEIKYNDLPLTFSAKSSDTASSVKVLIFISNFRRKKTHEEKSTETISFESIVEEIIRMKRQKYLSEMCTSISVDTEEKPVYTEEEVVDLRDELKQKLNDMSSEYEDKINNLLISYGVNDFGEIKDFIDAAVSPISWRKITRDLDDLEKFYNNNEEDQDLSSSTIKKKKPSKWGRNLPPFFERLVTNEEVRISYHRELRNRIIREVEEELLKKLYIENERDELDEENYEASMFPALPLSHRPKIQNEFIGRSFLKYNVCRTDDKTSELPALVKRFGTNISD